MSKSGFRIDYIGIGLISLGLGSMQIILDKGQRLDWLSSNFIRVLFGLMLVGIVTAIVWELREKEPVVDLRMLKDRNFAIATLAMFFLGFVLYSEYGTDSTAFTTASGLLGGDGWEGAVAGRRGHHVHDAGRGSAGVPGGHTHPYYVWLHRIRLPLYL